MPEAIRERVNRYLADTISAERNFEDALATFGKAGEQAEVQQLFNSFSAKAKTQHERLSALLEKRGGTPSTGKTILAEMLAFTPLSAQLGHGAAEKNTQHLMVVYAAAAAETAMYESLATAAEVEGDQETISLARTLQKEEHDDFVQTWGLLTGSAASSFQTEIGKGKSAKELLVSYLEDAIAAEKSFETQLLGFSKEAIDPTVQQLFRQHALETVEQYTQLEARLRDLGGSPSTLKSFMAHMFSFAPKLAQIGHDTSERMTQDLMMAYAVENAEVAMYESLATVAGIAGDGATVQLAKAIQGQEQQTADKVWAQIAPNARRGTAVQD